VPEEPGRVVAEKVDVLVAVCVGEHSSLAPDKGERERLVSEDRPRVTARQEPPGLLVEPLALRVALCEGAPLLRDERGKIRRHSAHSTDSPTCEPPPERGRQYSGLRPSVSG